MKAVVITLAVVVLAALFVKAHEDHENPHNLNVGLLGAVGSSGKFLGGNKAVHGGAGHKKGCRGSGSGTTTAATGATAAPTTPPPTTAAG